MIDIATHTHEGWAVAPMGTRIHFFVGFTSVCGRSMHWGRVYARCPSVDYPRCKSCVRKLAKP